MPLTLDVSHGKTVGAFLYIIDTIFRHTIYNKILLFTCACHTTYYNLNLMSSNTV